MPGFRLVSPVEREQQARYEALRRAEAAARQAILQGTRYHAAP